MELNKIKQMHIHINILIYLQIEKVLGVSLCCGRDAYIISGSVIQISVVALPVYILLGNKNDTGAL